MRNTHAAAISAAAVLPTLNTIFTSGTWRTKRSTMNRLTICATSIVAGRAVSRPMTSTASPSEKAWLWASW